MSDGATYRLIRFMDRTTAADLRGREAALGRKRAWDIFLSENPGFLEQASSLRAVTNVFADFFGGGK